MSAAATTVRPVGLFVLQLGRQVQLRKAAVLLPALLAGEHMLETLGALLPTRSSFDHLLQPAASANHTLEMGGNYLFLSGAWVLLSGAVAEGVSVVGSFAGAPEPGGVAVVMGGAAPNGRPVMVGAGQYAAGACSSQPDQQDQAEEEHYFPIESHNRRSFYNMTRCHVFDEDRDALRKRFENSRNQQQVQELIDLAASALKTRDRLYPTGGREAYLKAQGYAPAYKGPLPR